MIYTELSGGLGNQMFQYAFGRALSLTRGDTLTLIDRRDWLHGAPIHTACELGSLELAKGVTIVTYADLGKRALPIANACKALAIKHEQRGGMMQRDWNAFECRLAPFANRLGLLFATDGFVPWNPARLPKNLLLWGYFQAEEYFASACENIRRELRTRPGGQDISPTGLALEKRIAASACPVCIHLRRGDYQNPQNAALQVCTPAYYAAACAALQAVLPGAELFVFSDDLPWAREHLNTAGLPAVFAEGERPAAAELMLMQSCRHFILSNSTFSWWAQYLGDAPDKLVFAPDRWYANEKQTALYAPTWRRIPTGV